MAISTGFPLTGVDPSDPIPGIIRELKFAQGDGSGIGKARDVCLFGNKTTAGSETADTLGTAIIGLSDCIDRFGARSELTLMYRKYVEVDRNATIYAIPIAENGSGAASTCTITIVNTATGSGVVKITVLGETVEVGVQTGDLIATIASAIAAKINSQAHWPVTASPSSGVVTVTSANVGVRSVHHLNRLRATITAGIASTCTKSAVSAGTGADDNTNALAAAAASEFFYHVGPYDVATASATDNSLGEHAAHITSEVQPSVGKDSTLVFSTGGTQAQSTTVATTLNNALCFDFRAEDNDWSPAMIAAHCAAAKRALEIAHPGYGFMAGYGLGDGEILNIPDPYDKTDRPTTTEIRADLNNGVSAIAFTPAGKAYIVWCVTTRSVNGSDKDYRVRSGHIPSCIFYFWSQVKAAHMTTKQKFVAAEPGQGQKPLAGVTYPSAVKKTIAQKMEDAIAFPGGPYLDPSFLDSMKEDIQVLELAAGTSARAKPRAVRPNLKSSFLIEESSGAY